MIHVQHRLLPGSGLLVEGATVAGVGTTVGLIVTEAGAGIIGLEVAGSTVAKCESVVTNRWK